MQKSYTLRRPSRHRRAAQILWYPARVSAAGPFLNPRAQRHSAVVRLTHWLTVIAFFALLISGGEIVISHPRFYWGETGNVMMTPLFTLHIPSSRGSVPTGYGFVMPDQNGWSRALHFQSAWALLLTGLVYGIYILWTGHLGKNLFPTPAQRTARAFWQVIAKYLSRAPLDETEVHSYNAVQRAAYLAVIFLLFPLVIVTGLALSPAFNAAVPVFVDALGGRQSARTLHFFASGFLVFFLIAHVTMVSLAGFKSRMRAMLTGHARQTPERP